MICYSSIYLCTTLVISIVVLLQKKSVKQQKKIVKYDVIYA